MACERDEIWLKLVAAEARLAEPELINSVICSMDRI
jgi:hypothetical protein